MNKFWRKCSRMPLSHSDPELPDTSFKSNFYRTRSQQDNLQQFVCQSCCLTIQSQRNQLKLYSTLLQAWPRPIEGLEKSVSTQIGSHDLCEWWNFRSSTLGFFNSLPYRYLRRFKKTLSRGFQPSVFFVKRYPWVPLFMGLNGFEYRFEFAEKFDSIFLLDNAKPKITTPCYMYSYAAYSGVYF
jgi:hypothetical protein